MNDYNLANEDWVSRQAAIEIVDFECGGELIGTAKIITKRLSDLPSAQPEPCEDAVSRQAAIRWVKTECNPYGKPTIEFESGKRVIEHLKQMPSAQPERTWYPATEPPNHHNDVIVRGIEAIGNVTVHKIMQWDVDTWRPTDYAPSITWKEWSEI